MYIMRVSTETENFERHATKNNLIKKINSLTRRI